MLAFVKEVRTFVEDPKNDYKIETMDTLVRKYDRAIAGKRDGVPTKDKEDVQDMKSTAQSL